MPRPFEDPKRLSYVELAAILGLLPPSAAPTICEQARALGRSCLIMVFTCSDMYHSLLAMVRIDLYATIDIFVLLEDFEEDSMSFLDRVNVPREYVERPYADGEWLEDSHLPPLPSPRERDASNEAHWLFYALLSDVIKVAVNYNHETVPMRLDVDDRAPHAPIPNRLVSMHVERSRDQQRIRTLGFATLPHLPYACVRQYTSYVLDSSFGPRSQRNSVADPSNRPDLCTTYWIPKGHAWVLLQLCEVLECYVVHTLTKKQLSILPRRILRDLTVGCAYEDDEGFDSC
ncbi:hypothetical protein FB567DRAFT_627983, partial [Paraphoma chrysanthemicola]